ncbi:hypothetical protein SERLA73DRAFT_150198 [Serpula lacrymans var. lacrymans S7.3]|uniref:Uncharacterized protein n=1 Tax=Serpula lacrymans var. lacrymans (strain S7.3) TaxID=936435 RepID=F8PLG6_SERL3|nr:hypothetical protein SERLA73DRAFT_150198 [Serpula lacrymans var. lacrymans S7.3]
MRAQPKSIKDGTWGGRRIFLGSESHVGGKKLQCLKSRRDLVEIEKLVVNGLNQAADPKRWYLSCWLPDECCDDFGANKAIPSAWVKLSESRSTGTSWEFDFEPSSPIDVLLTVAACERWGIVNEEWKQDLVPSCLLGQFKSTCDVKSL